MEGVISPSLGKLMFKQPEIQLSDDTPLTEDERAQLADSPVDEPTHPIFQENPLLNQMLSEKDKNYIQMRVNRLERTRKQSKSARLARRKNRK